MDNESIDAIGRELKTTSNSGKVIEFGSSKRKASAQNLISIVTQSEELTLTHIDEAISAISDWPMANVSRLPGLEMRIVGIIPYRELTRKSSRSIANECVAKTTSIIRFLLSLGTNNQDYPLRTDEGSIWGPAYKQSRIAGRQYALLFECTNLYEYRVVISAPIIALFIAALGSNPTVASVMNAISLCDDLCNKMHTYESDPDFSRTVLPVSSSVFEFLFKLSMETVIFNDTGDTVLLTVASEEDAEVWSESYDTQGNLLTSFRELRDKLTPDVLKKPVR